MASSETKENLSKSAKRRQYILHYLEEKGDIKVASLSEHLGTSVVTIRKDLELLEQQNLLKRTHGGAVSVPKPVTPVSHVHKKEEKLIISRLAASLVKPDDYVLINNGSTSLFVCEELKHISNITIITNSVNIINSVISSPSTNLFILGGEVNHDMHIATGDDVLEQLNKYMADILFLGMDGVDIEMGATTYNHTEDSIIRKMIERSKKKYLIVDDSKIGRVTFAKVAELREFDGIITNYTPENSLKLERLRSAGINVITDDF